MLKTLSLGPYKAQTFFLEIIADLTVTLDTVNTALL